MAWDTGFEEFPSEDQTKWIMKASVWFHEHTEHVKKLMGEETLAYSPSGSDCGRPELWKAGHWRWYFQVEDK